MDPLVHHGRHFGRTVHALCNVGSLLKAGMLRTGELAERSEESFTAEYVVPFTVALRHSDGYMYIQRAKRACRIQTAHSDDP